MEKLPLFTGFYTSQVVQDFFHQPYHKTVWKVMILFERLVWIPRKKALKENLSLAWGVSAMRPTRCYNLHVADMCIYYIYMYVVWNCTLDGGTLQYGSHGSPYNLNR